VIYQIYKYRKRCSKSLVIGETQIKTIMRYHFIPTRTIIKNQKKKQKTTNVGENEEKFLSILKMGFVFLLLNYVMVNFMCELD